MQWTALDPRYTDVGVALLAPGGPDELGPLRLASRALAWGVLAVADHPGAAEQADRCLSAAFERAAAVPLPTGLHGGLVGLAWIAHHLEQTGVVDWAADATADLDDALLDALRSPWTSYDLVRGLVGVGTYALEHTASPFVAEALALVVGQLQTSRVGLGDGCAWATDPVLLSPVQRAAHPDGGFDLGVAHGVPGVIALLARCVDAGFAGDDAAATMLRAARWVVTHIRDTRLPAMVDREGRTSEGLDAWCYGAPGAGVCLLAAGRTSGDHEVQQAALSLLRAAARRVEDHTLRVDGTCHGLCHGAAGVGHLLNRAFQATGDPGLSSAAVLCLDRAERLVVGADPPDVWLTTGTAGTALAFLAAGGAVPAWDGLVSTHIPGAPR